MGEETVTHETNNPRLHGNTPPAALSNGAKGEQYVHGNRDSAPNVSGGKQEDNPRNRKLEEYHEKILQDLRDGTPLDFLKLNNEDTFTANAQNHNILHKVIMEIGQLNSGIEYNEATKNFISWLLKEAAFLKQVTDGTKLNPLDLAVAADKETCYELIRHLCEKGISHSPKEILGVSNIHDSRLDVMNGSVAGDGEDVDDDDIVTWDMLLQNNRDTCLHTAIRMKRTEYARYLVSRIRLDNAASKVLGHGGQEGLTPLHLAVNYNYFTSKQDLLVDELIDAYPTALSIESSIRDETVNNRIKQKTHGRKQSVEAISRGVKSSLSPFRYFLDTQEELTKKANAPDKPQAGKLKTLSPLPRSSATGWLQAKAGEIDTLLRINCMRYFGHDRESIIELLPLTLGQIHFDLTPRKEVSQDLLDRVRKIAKFESILQYISIPNLKVRNMKISAEAEEWWKSNSRKDYIYIFDWLKSTACVKKILKIVVEDDDLDYHSDEAIEYAVNSFDVESWNWMKSDMCSHAIKKSAPNVRDVTLYWSGNNAILRSWAAEDGLATLKQLRTVTIVKQKSIESTGRTDKNIKSFKDDFEKCWDTSERPLPTIVFESDQSKKVITKALSELERARRESKERWLNCMESFATFLKKYIRNNPLSEEKEIKVAIIDDGVNLDYGDIGTRVVDGETFYNNDGHWQGFYQSSNGHGTLMACLISQICPKVKLFIAKLNEEWTNSQSQITAESAAKAIDWARKKDVDIISMSWSIEDPGAGDGELKTAVEEAIGADILLFCASNDQGNLTTEPPYPARYYKEKIFTIGAATVLGLKDSAAEKHVNFIAPGAEFLKDTSQTNELPGVEPRTGSSIATARCAGLAALMLQCIVIGSKFSKKGVRAHDKMFKMLTNPRHYWLKRRATTRAKWPQALSNTVQLQKLTGYSFPLNIATALKMLVTLKLNLPFYVIAIIIELQPRCLSIHGLQDHTSNDSTKELLEGSQGSGGRLLWEDSGLLRQKFPDSRIIELPSRFKPTIRGVLSKESFDQKARELLESILDSRASNDPIVFLCLDVGGILLKRALVVAETNGKYSNIAEATCACVFFGTPQQVPDLSTWNEIFSGLISRLWHTIPRDVWEAIRSLPQYLTQNSMDFMEIAFRLTLVSVVEDDANPDKLPTTQVVHRPFAMLDVSHEVQIPRKVALTKLGRFMDEDPQAQDVVAAIVRGTAMTTQYRKHMRIFARLSPFTSFKFHALEGEDWIIQHPQYLKWLEKPSASILVLCGSHGVGKSMMSYFIYKRIIRRYIASRTVAYFAFDSQDCRRNSVSSMLMKLIRQIFARTPNLFSTVHDNKSFEDPSHWTEEELWIQLRTLIRILGPRSLLFIIDAIDGCETKNMNRFLNNLLHCALNFEIKILCTTSDELVRDILKTALTTETASLEKTSSLEPKTAVALANNAEQSATPALTDKISVIRIDDCVEYKANLKQYIESNLERLVAEYPKFMAVKSSIAPYISKAEGFLHTELTLHLLRHISSYSTPQFVLEQLPSVGKTMKDAIHKALEKPPLWTIHALSWILFVVRPLKPKELAIAITLLSVTPTTLLENGVDENIIPREIDLDLKRELGPLLDVGRGEVRVFHSYYVKEVLQQWIRTATPGLDDSILTRHCLIYLHSSLRKVIPTTRNAQQSNNLLTDQGKDGEDGKTKENTEGEDGKRVPTSLQGLKYCFLEYCIQYWHVHYRRAFEVHQGPPNAAKPGDVTSLVLDLLKNPSYMTFLAHLDLQYGNLRSHYSTDIKKPVHFAAQFGLSNVVEILLAEQHPEPHPEIISTLEIACRRGYPRIVRQLITRVSDTDPILAALLEPCKRGNDEVAEILISELGQVTPAVKYPPELLCQAARNGHGAIVKQLISAGADVKATFEGKTPLHFAAAQGHREVVEHLLAKNADLNAADSASSTALHHSLRNKHAYLARYLLDQPGLTDHPDNEGNTALQLAVECGDAALVEKVLDLRQFLLVSAEDKTKKDLSLHIASENGNVEIDGDEKSPLRLALENGREGVAQELLQRHDINVKKDEPYEDSPLKLAIQHGYIEITKKLLEKGADCDGYDSTSSSPLVDATKKRLLEIVKLLLDHGANPNKQVDLNPVAKVDGVDDHEWSALHCSAHDGYAVIAQILVQKQADFNLQTKGGYTPLHLAVLGNHTSILDLLLPFTPKNKIKASNTTYGKASLTSQTVPRGSEKQDEQSAPQLNINAKSEEGQTAMHLAAAFGHTESLTRLIEASGLTMERDAAGRTPLHLAASNGHQEIVAALLQQKVDPDSIDKETYTALHYAAEGGYQDVTKVLLAGKADADAGIDLGCTPIHLAAQEGHLVTLETLLENGAAVDAINKSGETILHHAAASGNKKMVSLILWFGGKPDSADESGNTPLHEAARCGHSEVVQMLLDSGASINAKNKRRYTPLQRAILSNELTSTKVLLDKGADTEVRDEDEDTALTVAIRYCYRDRDQIVEALLKRNASVDAAPNKSGNTALSLAVTEGAGQKLIETLIERGADLKIRLSNGSTLLHRAARNGNMELIKLLKGKVDLDAKDDDGLTPIHHGAQAGEVKVLRTLKDAGCDFAAKDGQGRTIMHLGIRTMAADSFSSLFSGELESSTGDGVNVADTDGWTPIHWACRWIDPEILDVLIPLSKDPFKECNRGWTPSDSPLSPTVEEPANTLPLTLSIARRPRDLEEGEYHYGVRCDGCNYRIWGIRFKCEVCDDFDFCFKCRWTAEKTHPTHTFKRIGRGPDEGPFSGESVSPSTAEESTIVPFEPETYSVTRRRKMKRLRESSKPAFL
ncbi:hypothetical protein G7Y89_g6885 [Cudoniella acicularis]|uniref:ZZ-type domain-containing protein n=1 Tax=Cudoniella acicularis TaxID=354080 RepID=A0A8H4W4C0_9HELO|nr:hypothetical protein G7Y89_g6885 [Cudoniella acicularis]